MKKVDWFSIFVTTALLTFSVRTEAQQPGKIFRIGFLDPSNASGMAVMVDAFRQELSKLGWVEGKNIAFEHRFAEGKAERIPELAADLVRLQVDLIVTTGVPPALEAKKATTTIPIVMVAIGDPVRVGLVSNLGRPGGNITGFTNLAGQIAAKRLQLLKEVIPTATRIGMIGNPGDPNALIQIQDAEAAARNFKIQLRLFTVKEAAQLEPAFEAARSWRAQALLRLADPLQTSLRARTIELAAKTRIPMMYASREDAVAGGLIGYGVDPVESYKRAAGYVDRILKGATPGDLPVQQPTKLELGVNLKTAAALNIKIPQAILAQADQVIE